MKKGIIVVLILLSLILCFNQSLFAQVDYTFVLEKTATSNDINIPIFQTLAAALVTDIDTISVVSYTDTAAYLFPPLPGNTPELIKITGEKIRSDPLKGSVSTNGISEAIKLANEQAAAYERKGATKKLIIIAGSGSKGKMPDIKTLDDNFYKNFVFKDRVFYISLDVEAEEYFKKLATLSSDETKFYYWAIDTQNPDPDPAKYVSLADGIYNCVHANAPQFKKINFFSDLVTFSAGNLLQQVGKMVVLVKNTGDKPLDDDAVYLNKSGVKVPNLSVFPQKTYSVMQVKDVNMGKFTVENGKIELVLVRSQISFIVFGAAAVILAVILLIIVISIAKAAKKGSEAKRPVYQVSYMKSGRDSGQLKANICKVRSKKEGDFESGVSIKSIVEYMGIKDKLDQKVVDDFYPRIVYRADSDAWFIEYNPDIVTGSSIDESVTAGTEDYDIFGGGSTTQTTESYDNADEESMPKDEQVTGSTFKIKRIFQNDLENKLVLTRIEY